MVLSPLRPLDVEHGFKKYHSTSTDGTLLNILMGFFVAWTWWTGFEAFQQTQRIGRVTPFVCLVWAQLAMSVVFIALVWSLVMNYLQPSFAAYFFILLGWATQIHFVAQVLVTRLCLLIRSEAERTRLRLGTFSWILFANLSCFCVWMPYHTQVGNPIVTKMVMPVDIVVSIMILGMDLYLNALFIKVVRARLIQLGLHKYDRVVKFTMLTIGVALFLDFFVIAFMWYPNAVLYMSLYPVVYQIKLAIELSMSRLIIDVANEHVSDSGTTRAKESQSQGIMVRTDIKKQVELNDDWMIAQSAARQIAIGTDTAVVSRGQRNVSHSDDEDEEPGIVGSMSVVAYPPPCRGRSSVGGRRMSTYRRSDTLAKGGSSDSIEISLCDDEKDSGIGRVRESVVAFSPSPSKMSDSGSWDHSPSLGAADGRRGFSQPDVANVV